MSRSRRKRHKVKSQRQKELEAIKQAREAQKLTQAELGEKMGVQRAQVCRLESGKSITLSSMMRAFRALGVQVALEMKGIGKVAL